MGNSKGFEMVFIDIEGDNVVEASEVRDVKWHTWSCRYGFPVQGIF